MVEKLGFCNLLEKMDPQYDLPSSIYFSKIAIPALYEEMQQILVSQSLLQKNDKYNIYSIYNFDFNLCTVKLAVVKLTIDKLKL